MAKQKHHDRERLAVVDGLRDVADRIGALSFLIGNLGSLPVVPLDAEACFHGLSLILETLRSDVEALSRRMGEGPSRKRSIVTPPGRNENFTWS